MFKKNMSLNKWEARKALLKVRISFLFIFILFVGFETGTPGYSLTNHISTSLFNNSATLQSAVNNNKEIRSLFIKEGITEADSIFIKIIDSNALGGPIKALIMIFLMYLTLYVINMKDPFSNYEKLEKLSLKAKLVRKFWGIGNELEYYSVNVPSANLFKVCNMCKHNEVCSNKLIEGDNKGMKKWSAIFGVLHPQLQNNDLSYVYSCRRAFYYKYMFLILGTVLTVYYFFIRSYEFLYRDHVNVNHGLIIFITGCFSFYLIFAWANTFKSDRDGGAWCKHRRHVRDMLEHRFFDEAFRERVCKCYDNPHYLERGR